MTSSALASLFLSTEPELEPEPAPAPEPAPLPEPRCSQCGERLARDRRTWAVRTLCVDCAFDDLPHTD